MIHSHVLKFSIGYNQEFCMMLKGMFLRRNFRIGFTQSNSTWSRLRGSCVGQENRQQSAVDRCNCRHASRLGHTDESIFQRGDHKNSDSPQLLSFNVGTSSIVISTGMDHTSIIQKGNFIQRMVFALVTCIGYARVVGLLHDVWHSVLFAFHPFPGRFQ